MPFLLRGDRTKNNRILPKKALLDGIHKDLLNGEGHDKWERSKKKRLLEREKSNSIKKKFEN